MNAFLMGFLLLYFALCFWQVINAVLKSVQLGGKMKKKIMTTKKSEINSNIDVEFVENRKAIVCLFVCLLVCLTAFLPSRIINVVEITYEPQEAIRQN